MNLKISDCLAGRFVVTGLLGVGGMSCVYAVVDLKLGKRWALKEVDIKWKEEIFAEANLLKTLNHPGIPRIVDIILKGNKIYVVMDLVEGFPLSDMRGIRLFVKNKEKAAKDLAEVVNYLHERKQPIIFCDLKPSNIIISKSGRINLLDFGAAYVKGSGEAPYLGTVGFASPEQEAMFAADEISDIYSFGKTLEYILKKGKSRADFKIRGVIKRCIKKSRNKRFKSVREILKYLERENVSFNISFFYKLLLIALSLSILMFLLFTFKFQKQLNTDRNIEINISKNNISDSISNLINYYKAGVIKGEIGSEELKTFIDICTFTETLDDEVKEFIDYIREKESDALLNSNDKNDFFYRFGMGLQSAGYAEDGIYFLSYSSCDKAKYLAVLCEFTMMKKIDIGRKLSRSEILKIFTSFKEAARGNFSTQNCRNEILNEFLIFINENANILISEGGLSEDLKEEVEKIEKEIHKKNLKENVEKEVGYASDLISKSVLKDKIDDKDLEQFAEALKEMKIKKGEEMINKICSNLEICKETIEI